MIQEILTVVFISVMLGLSTQTHNRFILKKGQQDDPISLWWMAPFLSGGGYSSEAISFALPLKEMLNIRISQHGDSYSNSFVQGLPKDTQESLYKMLYTRVRPQRSIVVCHSEPGAWALPKALYMTEKCPPDFSLYRIGRTMFETDRLTSGHVERCNKMDEIWVPTSFHYKTFTESGVDPNKVFVVPEAVDVDFFDPAKHEPLDLSKLTTSTVNIPSDHYKFLSIFKWERRKGWDVLLKAFLSEFSKDDKVTLLLKTNPYHSQTPFEEEIQSLINELELDQENLPHFIVLDGHIPTTSLPSLYKSVDAFVLPSRGEGWGRPHVEAMSMELPVIATNWSGPQEFLNDLNGYPLPLAGFEQILTGPFRGHQWADPSVPELKKILRHLTNNKEEAKHKGKLARKDMVEKYRPEVVAQIVVDRFNEIKSQIESGELPFVNERIEQGLHN